MPEEFALGLPEVTAAVRRTGLPAHWEPFEIRSPGHTLVEHEQILAEAWETLRARGLAGPDKLDIEVEQTLRAWTRPEVLIIVRAAELTENRQVFYRATIGHGLGVYSELVPEGINFVRIRPDHLVDALIGILPGYAPLPVAPATTTVGPNRPPDPEALRDYAQWAPHRHGTFELSTRLGQGNLRPVGTVNFVDTDGGRYLTFTDPLSGGESRLRFVPSDGGHLRGWLHERIAETTHR
ncbi:ESX secretion-associated protein EspG [Amycolatopsis sp. Hca4]|uniref:ESX secretion-associated protein EspG n=1 Tax=Amycolatopsis sp. Hca4 TaxID=2742131 RepID=UPI001590F9FA|nr:ESX secretion-associated protein EspG [Amycolatopsis sp. Hca4]QKV77875.1 ESX secretion-associated protein EspG [Amycolatopsis sp. Hca4]